MTVLSGAGVPLFCFLKILLHSLAHIVHVAEVVLGDHVVLFGGFFVPGSGQLQILFHSLPDIVHVAEIVLRADVTLFGQTFVNLKSRLVVLFVVSFQRIIERLRLYRARQHKQKYRQHTSGPTGLKTVPLTPHNQKILTSEGERNYLITFTIYYNL